MSKDAVIAAAVFESDEVHIYRLFDAKGDFMGDKRPLAPVLKFKLAKPEVYGNVVDLQIHKKVESNGQVDYQMYLVSANGVLYFPSIEKREDCKPVVDEQNAFKLTPNCSDVNSSGMLLVDAMQAQLKDGEDPKYTLRRYQNRDLVSVDVLEGHKDKLRFFRDQQIVELKQIKTGMQVSIYDFQNRLTVYCQSFPQVLFVEVEEDAIYVLTAQPGKAGIVQKQLFKLYEMEDNIKIQTLLKKGLFPEAQDIARAANFPGEIIAEISKEHADNLYEKKQYDDALK